MPLKSILHTSSGCSDTESQYNYRKSRSPFYANKKNGSPKHVSRFWHYREDQSSTASSDMECDREIARYCRNQKSVSFADEYPNRSALASSSGSSYYTYNRRERKERVSSSDRVLRKSASSSSECTSEANEDYSKNIPTRFAFYTTGNENKKELHSNVSRMYVASAEKLKMEITRSSTNHGYCGKR